MFYVLFVLWILIWGAAGHFTVRAIQMHIEKKRIEKAMASRTVLYPVRVKKADSEETETVYTPFGILL